MFTDRHTFGRLVLSDGHGRCGAAGGREQRNIFRPGLVLQFAGLSGRIEPARWYSSGRGRERWLAQLWPEMRVY